MLNRMKKIVLLKNHLRDAVTRKYKNPEYMKALEEMKQRQTKSVLAAILNREIMRRIGYYQNSPETLDELSSIKITRNALDKAQHAGKRVCEFGRQQLEVFSYLTMKKENESGIIDDIYIAKEQRAGFDTCRVSPMGFKESIDDIKKKNRSVAGWIHSHHSMQFLEHSGEDDYTTRLMTRNFGRKVVLPLIDDQDNAVAIPAHYTASIITSNLGNDRLYGAIGVEIPYFTGKNAAPEKRMLLMKDRRVTVIETGFPVEKNLSYLDDELLSRVSCNGKTLQELSGEQTRPAAGQPEHPARKSDNDLEERVEKEEVPAAGKDEEKDRQHPADIYARLRSLEERVEHYESSQKEYIAKLEAMERDRTRLQSEIGRLRGIVHGNGCCKNIRPNTAGNIGLPVFREGIKRYYAGRYKNSDPAFRNSRTIARMISGDYVVREEDIERYALPAEKQNKRIWFWKDRFEAFEHLYEDIRRSGTGLDRDMADGLKRIIKSNRYAARKYSSKINDLLLKIDSVAR